LYTVNVDELKSIRMRRADYERTLRLAQDVRVAELELAAIVERAKQKVASLRAVRDAHLTMLSRRYPGFQASDAKYRPDDATCTFHPVDVGSGEKGAGGAVG
jgi:hypothetical protein